MIMADQAATPGTSESQKSRIQKKLSKQPTSSMPSTKQDDGNLKGFLFAFTLKYFLRTSAKEVIDCLINGQDRRLAELLDDSLARDYCLTECEHYHITPFHSIAFVKCNIEMANSLLKIGISVDEPVKEKTLAWNMEVECGSRLLHLAAMTGHVKLIEELIERGADLNATAENGHTPLYVACHFGQAEAVSILIAGGASMDYRRPYDNGTLLHVAADCGSDLVCVRLLENGASVSEINNCGHSPLHIAAKRGYMKIVDILMKYNADVDQTNKYHMETSLHKACQYGQTETAVCLLGHGAAINATNRFGFTPLMKAVERGHGDTTEMLLTRNASVNVTATGRACLGQSPVHLAVLSKRSDILYMLLEKHAEVDKQDAQQRTPLFLAVTLGAVEPASLLSRYGATVNCTDKEGNTPMHIAAMMNNADIVNLLLDRNARIAARNSTGRTPLHLAVMNDAVEAVILLLGNFARPDLRDNDGHSCYDLATPEMRTVIAKNSNINR